MPDDGWPRGSSSSLAKQRASRLRAPGACSGQLEPMVAAQRRTAFRAAASGSCSQKGSSASRTTGNAARAPTAAERTALTPSSRRLRKTRREL